MSLKHRENKNHLKKKVAMDSTTSQFKTLINPRLEQLSQYISTENNRPSLSLEVLIDTFIAIHSDCKAITNANEQISGFLSKCKEKCI